MAITKAQTVQYPAVATVTFTYADIANGETHEMVDLPPGSVVVGGEVIVHTDWDGTAATIDVGDGADPDRFTATPADLMSTANTTIPLDQGAATGYKYTEADTIDCVVVITGTPTQGEAQVNIQYVVDDRGHEVQG